MHITASVFIDDDEPGLHRNDDDAHLSAAALADQSAAHSRSLSSRSERQDRSTGLGRVGRILEHAPVALTILILVLLVPRILALDRFVTIDEHLWLTRSANFYCALVQRDWANTFQREHPGVMTTWSGALAFALRAPEYGASCRQIDSAHHEQVLRAQGLHPIDLLATGRLFMVVQNTIALSIAYLYARRLIGPLPALFGFVLIAFDPFHVAHARLLHLDGLLSSYMLLAILAFGSYLRTRRTADLVVSGAATALAFLTKMSGALVLPFAGLVGLLYVRWEGRAVPFWAGAVWALVALAVVVALWPAMWADAPGTVSRMLSLAGVYSRGGHDTPVFFGGKIYPDGEIGAAVVQYYPLTYLWRATPAVLVGIAAALWALLRRHDLLPSISTRRAVIELGLFALLFALFVHLSAKKWDRYLLPVFLPLDLVAAVGWVALLRWLGRRRGKLWRRYVPATVLCLVVVVQVAGTLRTFPYYLSYYNPLLGGGRRAPQTMPIGWGEGIDQAARYLNARPDTEQLRVFAWYLSGCFSYLFDGDGKWIGWELGDREFQDMLNADYVVAYYTHQLQRGIPAPLVGYLAHQEPEHVVWIDGLEYVRLYRMNAAVETDAVYTPANALFGERILLKGHSRSQSTIAAGQTLGVGFSWQVIRASEERLKVFVHVLDSSGRLVAQHDSEPLAWRSPTSDWQVGEQYTDRHGVYLPPDLPAGEYRVWAGLYRLSGERLAVTVNGEPAGDALDLGSVTVYAPEQGLD